jgi:hypothetical protein
MGNPLKLLAILGGVLVAAIVLVVSSWWAGGFGGLVALFALGSAAILFLHRADILTNLPPGLKKTASFILFLSVAAIVVAGAVDRMKASEAKKERERRIRAASTIDLSVTHFTEAGPGMKILPGKNEVGISQSGTKWDNTGCVVAPEGWYFSEDHERRYDRLVKIGEGNERLYVPTLEIRGDCAKDGVGYLSTTHSGYRPGSFSARNHGKEPASTFVWLRLKQRTN